MNAARFISQVVGAARQCLRIPAGVGFAIALVGLTGRGQVMEYPVDGFDVTVVRGGSSPTAVGIDEGVVISAESDAPSVASVTYTSNEVIVSGIAAGTAVVTYAVKSRTNGRS